MKNKKRILLLTILFTFCMEDAYAETNQISAKYGYTVVYDSANKQMLMFGGSDPAGLPLSDLWAYNIEKKTWKKIKTDKIASPRFGHSAIYDSDNKQMLIFGGLANKGYCSDLLAYDIEQKTWKKIKTEEAPLARGGHSAIYDLANKQMIIWGGYSDSGFLFDTWTYDIEQKTWKKIKTEEAPLARRNPSILYDSTNKQMLMFGGRDMDTGFFSDLWTCDIEKKTWEEIDADGAPPARDGHTAIYDSENRQMFIFGGRDREEGRLLADRLLSDLWAYNIEKKTWERIETDVAPSARSGHSAVYIETTKQMLIFGGIGGQKVFFSDLWAFDIEKRTWEKLEIKFEKD